MTGTVLTQRQLNRAFLARQHLLARTAQPVLDVVEHLIGVQAQEVDAPYFALWSRVADFDAHALSAQIEAREAVRMGLMRWTMHLVSARDAPGLRALLDPSLRAKMLSSLRRSLTGVDLDELAAIVRAKLADGPRTLTELREPAAERFPEADRLSVGYAIPALVPLVQTPPRGLWGASGGVRLTPLDDWVGAHAAAPMPAEDFVLRYLRAFGPATVADARTFSGLAGLREVFERLRPQLRTFRDERGRELFDVPDGVLPDPETPAPPRFLGDFDNAVLGHDDRSRIIGDEHRKHVIDGYRFFLVDGMVRGHWRSEGRGAKAKVVLEPFGRISRPDRAELHEELERLRAFTRTA